MEIKCIDSDKAPLDLLLLADPSRDSIASYLHDSVVFLVTIESKPVGVSAVVIKGKVAEIKNIAVATEYQHRGIGKKLMEHIKLFARKSQLDAIKVGTGNSSLQQLSFYQKSGFRIKGVITDYFASYRPEIYENGIRCIDMILLEHKVISA
ncbi:MAG: GNAT family N-acetyltransferase [Symploca sp. SIO2G7]|nr:GNAT family N-acetyltransferase [Symploca sp. SIO2G7]